MEDPLRKIQAFIDADGLFGALAAALAEFGPGCFHACGTYVLEAVTGSAAGGILILCAAPVEEVGRKIEAATGLRPLRSPSRDGVLSLEAPGERGVALVPRLGGLAEDLSRAGFTVTAMGIALGRGPTSFFDPLGGIADLEAGRLVAASKGAIEERPRLLLAAATLSSRFGLTPGGPTLEVMRAAAPAVRDLAPRAAWRALSRALSCRGLSRTACLLRDSGVLDILLPEVAAIYDTPQNYYHHAGVWGHTLETLDRLEEMLADPSSRFKAYGHRVSAYLTRSVEGEVLRRPLLALAGLIHDAGKAQTMNVEPSGRIRFKGHAIQGAGLAEGVARRLGLGRRASRHLVGIVRDHMRLGYLIKEGETTASRLRVALDLGDHCVEVILLSVADRLATRGQASTPEAVERYCRVASRVLADWFWLRDVPPLLGGGEVMVHSGLEPGPAIGDALLAARVAQRESTICDRAQALEFLAPDFKGKMDTRGG